MLIKKKIFYVLFFSLIVGCSSSSKENSEEDYVQRQLEEQKYKACTEKGVKYYWNLGSYPYLSTGQSADEKIKRACDINVAAFD